ncbi:MAG TPA: hypothetical protein VKW06_02065 [Candidatus Angelobacter sp.]|nr:hypothetical protein [Candidatus Angelobacter sp.]
MPAKLLRIRIASFVFVLSLALSGTGYRATAQAGAETGSSHAPKQKKTAAVEPNKDKEARKLSEEHQLAYQTLEASEGAARGFEAPMRSYGLLQIGATLATQDASKAKGLLRDAFTASLEIRDDDDTKSRLQQEILRALLPLSQPDVEELLPQAESSVRRPITDLIVGNYAQSKQFDKGLELINQIAAVDEFPYASAGKLMDAMPPEMMAEKQALLIQAVASYKSHEHPDVRIGPGTLTGMITHFASIMPPRLVLQAIDEVLSQTKSKANQDIRLAGTGGSASFASDYQYQLFALLPTLRKLDPSRARQLLDENQDLQAKMQQFPDGMSSLMPPPVAGAGAKGTGPNTSSTMFRTVTSDRAAGASGPGPAGAPPIGTVQDYLRREMRAKMESIALEAEADPAQAIAHSAALPLQMDDGPQKSSPRSQALESIARANVKKSPAAAESALGELRRVVVDLPPRTQAQYLAGAADLYLQMEARENAEKVVGEGFKVAEKLLLEDTDPESPNQALKAWWPSTDAYRRFVEVETKISYRATIGLLKEMKDPEIRATESIVFARSLLGLPLKRFTVVERRGNNTKSYTTDSN